MLPKLTPVGHLNISRKIKTTTTVPKTDLYGTNKSVSLSGMLNNKHFIHFYLFTVYLSLIKFVKRSIFYLKKDQNNNKSPKTDPCGTHESVKQSGMLNNKNFIDMHSFTV